ncbi:ethanolamine ammonia-lyase subunit EutB, partial [Staphylococcus coagulans]|uniref:ethanolamine ammonia-lyase subunit EutB n=1 Tax=Staphylococcus coagulans TaxID=74706 RepID=UPI001BE6191D
MAFKRVCDVGSAGGRRTPEGPLVYRHTIDATTYTFADLRDLLAKATPPRSGDRLAGIAAGSAEQMIAARM